MSTRRTLFGGPDNTGMPTTSDSALSAAVELVNQGRKTEARQLLRDILRQDPRNDAAWLVLANCASTRKEWRDCVERALSINPENTKARSALEALTKSQRPAQQRRASRGWIVSLSLGFFALLLVGGVLVSLSLVSRLVSSSASAAVQAAPIGLPSSMFTPIHLVALTPRPSATAARSATPTPSPTNTPTPMPTSIPVAFRDFCAQPQAFAGLSIRVSGKLLKVEPITEGADTALAFYLVDPLSIDTPCISGSSLLPVTVLMDSNADIDFDALSLGVVLVAEGVGQGSKTLEGKADSTAASRIILGSSLVRDPVCSVILEVDAYPNDVILYLDRFESATGDPVRFENVCPGRHSLSVENVYGYLIGEAWLTVPPDVSLYSTRYVYRPPTSDLSHGIPDGCYNCP